MKQIVPFTKKISFDTSVDEITSISLDKKVKNIEDGIISGSFDLYLEYKESDISVNTLKYNSIIPFDIDIDEKYLLDNVKIDIDDFYYEIEDDEVILHIDVLVDNLEYAPCEIDNIISKKEESFVREEKDEFDEIFDIKDDSDINEEINEIERCIDEEDYIEKVKKDDANIKIEDLFKELDETVTDVKTSPKIPIFESFDSKNETYVTYNVHIVREDDSVDSICLKYGVTKEDLSYYNDINLIKLGDKLIVPSYKK